MMLHIRMPQRGAKGGGGVVDFEYFLVDWPKINNQNL
jgi:hypothetical protein